MLNYQIIAHTGHNQCVRLQNIFLMNCREEILCSESSKSVWGCYITILPTGKWLDDLFFLFTWDQDENFQYNPKCYVPVHMPKSLHTLAAEY